jgi:hypothetical protein
MMNSTFNETGSKLDIFKRELLLVNCVLLAVVGITIVVVDGILLLVIKADPFRSFDKQKVFIQVCFLLTSLFGGVVLVPLFIAFEIYKDSLSDQAFGYFKLVLVFLTRMFIANENFTFTLSATEGALGLVKPHIVRRLATRKNVKKLLLSFNIVSLIYCFLPLSGAGTDKLYTTIYIHVFVLIPLIYDVCFTGYIYYRLRHPARVGHMNKNDFPSARQKENISKRNKQIARNFMDTIALFLCPFCIFSLSYYLSEMLYFDHFAAGCGEDRWCYVGERLVVLLAFLFPVSNSFAIIFKIPMYKRSVKYYLCCKKTRAPN